MSMEAQYRYTKWYQEGRNRKLVEWMVKHKKAPRKMAEETGLGRTTIYRAIFGDHQLSQYSVDVLLKYTGMKYEELF